MQVRVTEGLGWKDRYEARSLRPITNGSMGFQGLQPPRVCMQTRKKSFKCVPVPCRELLTFIRALRIHYTS